MTINNVTQIQPISSTRRIGVATSPVAEFKKVAESPLQCSHEEFQTLIQRLVNELPPEIRKDILGKTLRNHARDTENGANVLHIVLQETIKYLNENPNYNNQVVDPKHLNDVLNLWNDANFARSYY